MPVRYEPAGGCAVSKSVSSPTFGIGCLMCIWTGRKQCLHDKIADGLVVKKQARACWRSGWRIARCRAGVRGAGCGPEFMKNLPPSVVRVLAWRWILLAGLALLAALGIGWLKLRRPPEPASGSAE